MKYRQITRFVVFLFASVFITAGFYQSLRADTTGKIQGRVTDAETGESLAGTTIQLVGTGRGAFADEDGFYVILNVPFGLYSLKVALIGYTDQTIQNVRVSFDKVVNVDVALSVEVLEIGEETIVTAERPVVDVTETSVVQSISQQEIASLPVQDLSDILNLQQGFITISANRDQTPFSQERGVDNFSVRGGRSTEVRFFVDNLPVQDALRGGRGQSQINSEAIGELDFLTGGFDPQYGNALSGISNIVTPEGGSAYRGAFEYQTSEITGSSIDQDDLRGLQYYEASIEGPVPGTEEKVRVFLSGAHVEGADEVYEYDNKIYITEAILRGSFGQQQAIDEDGNPIEGLTKFDQADQDGDGDLDNTEVSNFNTNFNVDRFDLAPHFSDHFPGWRGFGWNNNTDVLGKVTIQATPTSKFNLLGMAWERNFKPFSALFLWQGINQCQYNYFPGTGSGTSGQCEIDEEVDTTPTYLTPNQAFKYDAQGNITNEGSVSNSGKRTSQRGALSYDYVFPSGRSFVTGRVAQFRQTNKQFNEVVAPLLERDENGNLVPRHDADGNAIFKFRRLFPEEYITTRGPAGTGFAAAGTGPLFANEFIKTWSGRADYTNQITNHHELKFGWEGNFFDFNVFELQDTGINAVAFDTVQYDVTPWETAFYFQDNIDFDFMHINAGVRLDWGKTGGEFLTNPEDPTNGTPSFIDETGNRVDRSSDDFTETKTRFQFSPRINVSHPITSTSNVFFNFGRYSQIPIYENILRNAGVGVPGDVEGTPAALDFRGSTEGLVFIGNAILDIERTTSFEVGFNAQVGEDYSVKGSVFIKDQNGLTGVNFIPFFDRGNDFGGGNLAYRILLNQDFASVRGIDLNFAKRLSNYWSFSANYTFQQARTNAPEPLRAVQDADNQDPIDPRREIVHDDDQPHVFNFRGNLSIPRGEGPTIGGKYFLEETNVTVTFQANSGLPFTPTFDILGLDQAEVNSGRRPAQFQVDLRAQRGFSIAGFDFEGLISVINLLDRKNAVEVFPTTGRPDTGVFDNERRRGDGRRNDPRSLTSSVLNRADFYGDRRFVSLGIRVSY